MEKKQFHARTVSRTVRSAGTGNFGAVKQFFRRARAHPEAAAWWRENTPHLIAPKRYLVFHEEVCRLADI
jgi:hypothetical protein